MTFNTEDLETELNTIQLHDTLESSMKPTSTTQNSENKNKYNETQNNIPDSDSSRPRTLKDFEKEKFIKSCNEESSFTFNGLDLDEELWVMDVPGTIDPLDLKGLTIQLGDKSKFKIKQENYCALNKDNNSSFTLVFNTNDESTSYKTVNIKPNKMIKLRRKLSNISKKKFESQKSECVPFPKNLKQRYPIFGVQST